MQIGQEDRAESSRLGLKKLEHPYLHELFKSVLLYDAELVKKKLAVRIGGKLLEVWKLERAYQEILGRTEEGIKPKADIVWLLSHPGREELGTRRIIHEVKTGRWDLEEQIEQYLGVKIVVRRTDRYYPWVATTNTPLYIWSWKKYFPSASAMRNTRIERGAVRILPLDLLLPIMYQKLEDIFKWK